MTSTVLSGALAGNAPRSQNADGVATRGLLSSTRQIERRDFIYRFFQASDIQTPVRVLRYVTAGGTATFLYAVLFTSQVKFMNFHPVVAACAATLIVDISVYFTNRLWVYRSSLDHTIAIARFLVTVVMALVINAGLIALIVDVLGLWYLWALVATVLILPPTNFLLNLYWTFR